MRKKTLEVLWQQLGKVSPFSHLQGLKLKDRWWCDNCGWNPLVSQQLIHMFLLNWHGLSSAGTAQGADLEEKTVLWVSGHTLSFVFAEGISCTVAVPRVGELLLFPLFSSSLLLSSISWCSESLCEHLHSSSNVLNRYGNREILDWVARHRSVWVRKDLSISKAKPLTGNW